MKLVRVQASTCPASKRCPRRGSDGSHGWRQMASRREAQGTLPTKSTCTVPTHSEKSQGSVSDSQRFHPSSCRATGPIHRHVHGPPLGTSGKPVGDERILRSSQLEPDVLHLASLELKCRCDPVHIALDPVQHRSPTTANFSSGHGLSAGIV